MHTANPSIRKTSVVYRALKLKFAGHTDRYDRDKEYLDACSRRETPRTLLMSDGTNADDVFGGGPRR